MSVDGLTVRKAVHDYVSENPRADYDTVVANVCDTVNATEKRVCDEIKKMEENGFVYLVDAEEATEVKVA
jgi:hypothetical protein